MNKIRFNIFVLFAMCIIVGQAHAQDGFAGPDKHIPFKANSTEPTTTTLTAAASGSNCCFKWTSSDNSIVSDPNQQTITVKPKKPKSVYTVTRASSTGTQEDVVVVFLDEFDIVSVTPNKKCYKANDEIKVEDFTIVTDPAGFGAFVEVSPKRIQNFGSGKQKYNTNIKFYEDCGDHSERLANITVVDESMETSLSSEEFKEFLELVELVSRIDSAFMIGKTILEKIDSIRKLIPVDGPGCKGDYEPSVKFDLKKCLACCDDEIKDKIIFTIDGSATGSIECKFPIPGASVGVAGVNATLGTSITLGAAADIYLSKCKEDPPVILSVKIGVEGRGGISVDVLSPSVLELKGEIVAKISVEDLKIECAPPVFKTYPPYLKGSISMVFNAKAISILKCERSITLVEIIPPILVKY